MIDPKTKSVLTYLQARINQDEGKGDLIVTKHLMRETMSLFLFGAHLTKRTCTCNCTCNAHQLENYGCKCGANQ